MPFSRPRCWWTTSGCTRNKSNGVLIRPSVVDVEHAQPREVFGQPRVEVPNVLQLARCPRHFGEGRETRKHHVLDVLRGSLVFRPDLSLGAEDVGCLRGIERGGHLLHSVDGGVRPKTADPARPPPWVPP